MRAVTFQGREEVRVEEKPEPELRAGDDVIVAVEATGICGSDLHIYHGRFPVEPGFTIGHEFVGTVIAAGEEVERVGVGDRVLGCFHTACATCTPCLRGDYHRCRNAAHLRPRRRPRRPPGRSGRAAAGPAREPDPAAGAGGDELATPPSSPAT